MQIGVTLQPPLSSQDHVSFIFSFILHSTQYLFISKCNWLCKLSCFCLPLHTVPAKEQWHGDMEQVPSPTKKRKLGGFLVFKKIFSVDYFFKKIIYFISRVTERERKKNLPSPVSLLKLLEQPGQAKLKPIIGTPCTPVWMTGGQAIKPSYAAFQAHICPRAK